MNKTELKGYSPGAIGRITELHGLYYSKHWQFGLFFEAKVAEGLSEFLSRFDENLDFFRTVWKDGRIEGGIAVDGSHAQTEGARLRWFILSPEVCGQGMGNRLMEEAVNFCKSRKFGKMYLTTFEGLEAARHLYEKFGFRLVSQEEGNHWGTSVTEQRFELELP